MQSQKYMYIALHARQHQQAAGIVSGAASATGGKSSLLTEARLVEGGGEVAEEAGPAWHDSNSRCSEHIHSMIVAKPSLLSSCSCFELLQAYRGNFVINMCIYIYIDT